jgi:hypothetical protein
MHACMSATFAETIAGFAEAHLVSEKKSETNSLHDPYFWTSNNKKTHLRATSRSWGRPFWPQMTINQKLNSIALTHR